MALPGIPIAVHSARDDPAHAASLIRRGAGGVITTAVTREVAVAALRLVAAGGVYAAHAAFMERDPAGPTASASAAGAGPRLTQRETAILALIGRALSNKEISQRLGLAEATVKTHVRNLLRKTRLRKRIELALLAAQGGH